MSRRPLVACICLCLAAACSDPTHDETPPVTVAPADLVDPFIGTGGGAFAQGQAFVGAQLPFGWARPGPDSGGLLPRSISGFAHCSGYWWNDTEIEGFSQLHLHGTGIEDLGTVLIAPVAGGETIPTDEASYAQGFSHDDEDAAPGYYAVTLANGVRAELTAGLHLGQHRFTFPDADAILVVDVSHGIGDHSSPNGEVSVGDDGEAFGWMLNAGRFTGTDRAFEVYFSAIFDPPPTEVGTFSNGVSSGELTASGADIGAWLRFDAETVDVQVGTSLIDVATARQNRGEARSFEVTRDAARASWNDALGVIEVEGGDERVRRIFYTALYHAMLMPTQLSETAGYVGLDRQVSTSAPFTYYSDFSMWDTYRTTHPLLTLIAPDRARDFAQTLLAMGDANGTLPRWPLLVNETGTMIGSPASIILADTFLRGVTAFDVDAAVAFAVDDANGVAGRSTRPAGCLDHEWCAAGETRGPVATTQEYGWADFAIARLLEARGENALAADFDTRARRYRALWDEATGFFRGRDAAGAWSVSDFAPETFTDDYVEGNAWHYLWAAPYDVAGLVELMGGADAFADRLEAFFEDSEEAAIPLGTQELPVADLYYWHGNEPDIHAAYLFALAGVPERGARWIDWVRKTKYDDAAWGLAGNDDAGTLSAWYVFSALGLYPLAGSDVYIVGTPLFDRAVLHLPGGDLVLRAERDAPGALVVREVRVDGAPLEHPWVDHATLASAREIVFVAGVEPAGWRSEPYAP